MVSNYSIFSKRINEKVNAIYQAHKNEFIIYQNCRNVALSTYRTLESHASKHNFKNEEEEIRYFKKTNPSIFSLLLLYARMQKILLKMDPLVEEKIYRDSIVKEIKNVKLFYTNNLEFIRYYRAQQTHLDHIYFLSKNINLNDLPPYVSIYPNTKMICNKGHILAEFLAYEHLIKFLNLKLKNRKAIYHPLKKTEYKTPQLVWSASKADLTELIYGLKYTNSINEGKAGIKEITSAFERLFKIRIKDPYNTFKEIKIRKKESSSFLKTLYDKINKLSQM